MDDTKNIINPEGPSGESIFHHLIQTWLTVEQMSTIQARIDNDLKHVKQVKDDRLLVLLGALLIENAVDELIAAIMPGFKRLRDNKDFTFSMRVAVAQSLQLIPSRILQCADIVRQIRNDFAHELSVDSFDKLKPNKLQTLRQRLNEYNSADVEGKSNAEIFEKLVSFTVVVLYAYTIHVTRMSSFIRSSDFMPQLRAYVEQQK